MRLMVGEGGPERGGSVADWLARTRGSPAVAPVAVMGWAGALRPDPTSLPRLVH